VLPGLSLFSQANGSYGDVPILLCSAGIQRIVALAYLLVWAWQSHIKTTEAMRKKPEQSIVLLIDEMEAHLHPFWQRTIVPALMGVVHKLTSKVQVQMIIATHSPLVLASVEPLFNDETDNLFHPYLENGLVQLDEIPFVKRGRVDQWLTSDIFGLVQPRSIDAERAIEVANKLQLENDPPQEEVQKVSHRLINVLAPDDEFWPLWTYFAKQRGVTTYAG
jgi:AAA domain, putative AbiEii toxin, Type IV TA system